MRPADEQLLEDALSILEVADAVIALREALRSEGVDALTRRMLRRTGAALARAHEKPSTATQTNAREEIRRASARVQSLLHTAGPDAREAAVLQHALRCLHRLDRALPDELAVATQEQAHAA